MIRWNARALVYEPPDLSRAPEPPDTESWMPFGEVVLWLDPALEQRVEGTCVNDNGWRFGSDRPR